MKYVLNWANASPRGPKTQHMKPSSGHQDCHISISYLLNTISGSPQFARSFPAKCTLGTTIWTSHSFPRKICIDFISIHSNQTLFDLRVLDLESLQVVAGYRRRLLPEIATTVSKTSPLESTSRMFLPLYASLNIIQIEYFCFLHCLQYKTNYYIFFLYVDYIHPIPIGIIDDNIYQVKFLFQIVPITYVSDKD